MVILYIHLLSLLFQTPIQISPLFYFLILLFFNSATFIVLLSLLSNSCLKSARNSPTITNIKLPVSRSFITSSFYISTDPPYTYDSTYYTYSSTNISLIFILMYSLHAVKKPKIFPASLLNIYSLATSMFDPVLGLRAIVSPFPSTSLLSASNSYNATICSCYYLI